MIYYCGLTTTLYKLHVWEFPLIYVDILKIKCVILHVNV